MLIRLFWVLERRNVFFLCICENIYTVRNKIIKFNVVRREFKGEFGGLK